ncbi:hypothetical protein NFI96_020747 [Prochilodus magdalenae]|nr:hypothetical protein NFI96_020747 [Prochilodus magdalenae]
MDSVLIRLLLGAVLLFSVFSVELPAPVKVTVDSRHFVHLLRWEAGPGSPEDVHYTVKSYLHLEKKWKLVEGCEMVRSRLQCNLTEVLSDPYKTYYINVSAHLGNLSSTPASKTFIPLESTVPEPPSVTVSQCRESVCAHLDAPSKRLRGAYNCTEHTVRCFVYRLDVTCNGELKLSKVANKLETVVLEHLVPGQRYCVSVTISNRNSTNSPAVCTTTTAPTSRSVVDAVVSVVMCLVVLLCCVSVGVLLVSGFLCLKAHLPSVLSSFQSPYKVLVLVLPVAEPLTTISLEPSTCKDSEGGGESDGEVEGEDEEVAYECLKGQTATPDSSSSSIPPALVGQYGCPRDSPVSDISTSPTPVPEALCSPDATEHGLTPPCAPGFGFQRRAAGWTLPTGPWSTELRNKDFSAHTPKDKEEQEEEECGINVNLLSLTLGGCPEKEELEEEKTGNLENQELPVPSSPHRTLGNASDIELTCSPSPDRHVTDEEEEEEEEEDFSGYMKRY